MEENKRNEETLRINQENLRNNQENLRYNQGALRIIQEIQIIKQDSLRIIQGEQRSFQERLRILEEQIRRIEEDIIRINWIIDNNELNNILNKLPVVKIEDINKLKDENKRCVICLEDFLNNDNSIFLPCFHLFHEKCITDWINMKKGFCPLCRTIINNMM